MEIPGDRDTTYWCVAREIPRDVLQQQHYIYMVRFLEENSESIRSGNVPTQSIHPFVYKAHHSNGIFRVDGNLHATIKILLHAEYTYFIPQYGPSITPNNTAFVHHIIVYLCGALVNITDGTSSVCMGEASLAPISQCRQGTTIAGWAVGGEVYSNCSIINHYCNRPSDLVTHARLNLDL